MTRRGALGVLLIVLAASLVGPENDRLGAQSREALVTEGRRLFTDRGCYGCHTVGAAGTPIGPDLRAAAARHSEPTLARWLQDPAAQEPTRHMPNLGLSPAEARALAAYLASLR
jgi:mono/diheme cytochrome c family protein